MPNELEPVVDQWYRPEAKGDLLRVVAADMDTGLVEVQYFDGSVEELDMDAWHELDIDLADEPEDWTGPYDDIEADDLGDAEITTVNLEWRASSSGQDADEEAWQDDRPQDEGDSEADDRPEEPYASEEKPEADV